MIYMWWRFLMRNSSSILIFLNMYLIRSYEVKNDNNWYLDRMWKGVVVVKFTVGSTIWQFEHRDWRKPQDRPSREAVSEMRLQPETSHRLPLLCDTELLDMAVKLLISQPLTYAFKLPMGSTSECWNSQTRVRSTNCPSTFNLRTFKACVQAYTFLHHHIRRVRKISTNDYSFVTTVCLSDCMEQLGSNWTVSH